MPASSPTFSAANFDTTCVEVKSVRWPWCLMASMAKVFGDTVCKELDLQRPRSDLQRAEER